MGATVIIIANRENFHHARLADAGEVAHVAGLRDVLHVAAGLQFMQVVRRELARQPKFALQRAGMAARPEQKRRSARRGRGGAAGDIR